LFREYEAKDYYSVIDGVEVTTTPDHDYTGELAWVAWIWLIVVALFTWILTGV
jgi:hypothetical protein